MLKNNTNNQSFHRKYSFIFQFLDTQGLKRNSSIWERIDHTAIIDEFPMLSEDDIIRNITLGEQIALSLFKRI